MNILFLGAHPDDVEMGCLCTLLKHQEAKDKIHYILMSDGNRAIKNEVRLTEYKKVLKELSGVIHMNLHLPDTKLYDTENREKIRWELERKRDFSNIGIVYTHWKDDIHQDHRAVAEESIRVFRYHTVLQYEIVHSCPKFEPDCYVKLTEEEMNKKLQLLKLFKSQETNPYFNAKNFESAMKFRGSQAGLEYAEAFKIWRLIQPRGF